jgi:hypothetical protein
LNICVRACTGVESYVEAAVCIHSRNASPAGAVISCKRADDHDLSVGLERRIRNGRVRACTGIECYVVRTIRVQACDTTPVLTGDVIEVSDDDEFSVGLTDNALDSPASGRTAIHE